MKSIINHLKEIKLQEILILWFWIWILSKYFTDKQSGILFIIVYFLWISINQIRTSAIGDKTDKNSQIIDYINSRSRKVITTKVSINWQNIIKRLAPNQSKDDISKLIELFYKDNLSLLSISSFEWRSDTDNFFNSYLWELKIKYFNEAEISHDISNVWQWYKGNLFWYSYRKYTKEICDFFWIEMTENDSVSTFFDDRFRLIIQPWMIYLSKSSDELGNMSGYWMRQLDISEEMGEELLNIPYWKIIDTYFEEKKMHKTHRSIIKKLNEDAKGYKIEDEYLTDWVIEIESDFMRINIELSCFNAEITDL